MKPNYIYLIQFTTGIKVGITGNLKQRTDYYKLPWVQSYTKFTSYKVSNAQVIERCIKRKFKTYTNSSSTEYFFGVTYDEIHSYLKEIINDYSYNELVTSTEGLPSNSGSAQSEKLPKKKRNLNKTTEDQKIVLEQLLGRKMKFDENILFKQQVDRLIQKLLNEKSMYLKDNIICPINSDSSTW